MSASVVAADGSNVGSNDASDELTSGSGDGDRNQTTFADVARRPPTFIYLFIYLLNLTQVQYK